MNSDCETSNVFDAAIQLAETAVSEFEWSDDAEIAGRTVCQAIAISSGFADYIPETSSILFQLYANRGACDYQMALNAVLGATARDRLKSTEFIVGDISADGVRSGFDRYNITETSSSIVEFVFKHKPCCRLRAITWLIPKVGMGPSLIRLISYAAETFSSFFNDPIEPFCPDCISIGNSWLHRLGVFLLYQCAEQSVAPPYRLIRLLSMVSQPPSQSVKQGKCVRMLNELAGAEAPDRIWYAHEAPTDVAVGNYLALELSGALDANRQYDYIRKMERAVAYYARSLLCGERPSISQIQFASKLTWQDAKGLIDLECFHRLVFEQQCRHILARHHSCSCPECASLQDD